MKYITVKQAAEKVGKSAKMIILHCRTGNIEYVGENGYRLINEDSLDRYYNGLSQRKEPKDRTEYFRDYYQLNKERKKEKSIAAWKNKNK